MEPYGIPILRIKTSEVRSSEVRDSSEVVSESIRSAVGAQPVSYMNTPALG